MSELSEIYALADGEPEKVLARFGGNEKMLRHFLCLFAQDGSFTQLQSALAAGETEAAFRAAHTLKGICANLGFERLYKEAAEMTELLRHGELDRAKPLFPALEEMYKAVVDVARG